MLQVKEESGTVGNWEYGDKCGVLPASSLVEDSGGCISDTRTGNPGPDAQNEHYTGKQVPTGTEQGSSTGTEPVGPTDGEASTGADLVPGAHQVR